MLAYHLHKDEKRLAVNKMTVSRWMRRWLASAMAGLLLLTGTVFAETAGRDVTFISTSDSHYVTASPAAGGAGGTKHKDRNANDRKTVLAINAVTGLTWPASVGGGPIDAPRGVMLLGDVIDDGDVMFEGINKGKKQYEFFLADFGLDGTDGVLKYPVFETWGNHDGPPVGKERHGFSFQAKFKQRNAIRKQKGLIKNLSDNGLHYSWDWDDVHFVMLGIYPADVQNPRIRYNPVWHNPQGALTFLRQDLAKNVGNSAMRNSGRPVILMAHCGMDTDWWHKEDWKAFYDVASPYNVVAYIYGHSGTGLREWAPTQSQRKLLCINDGQTENGFFVIQLQNDRMRYGYYGKQWRTEKGEDGRPIRTWEGNWIWRFTGTASLPPMKAK